eukprot:Hpha_TRINITY_DN15768_c1_g2::TRINITY_DN15768_c1_g2_i1::g.40529::m.40529
MLRDIKHSWCGQCGLKVTDRAPVKGHGPVTCEYNEYPLGWVSNASFCLVAGECALGVEFTVGREADARERPRLGDGIHGSGVGGDEEGLASLTVERGKHDHSIVLSLTRRHHLGLRGVPAVPRPHLGRLRPAAHVVLHDTHVSVGTGGGVPGVRPEVAVLAGLDVRVDHGEVSRHRLVGDNLVRHRLALVKRKDEAGHRVPAASVTNSLVLHGGHVGANVLEGVGLEGGEVDDDAGLSLVGVDGVDEVKREGLREVADEGRAPVQRNDVEGVVGVTVAGEVEVREHLGDEREAVHFDRDGHARHHRVVHRQSVRVHVRSRPHRRRVHVLPVRRHLGLPVDGVDDHVVLHALEVHLLPVRDDLLRLRVRQRVRRGQWNGHTLGGIVGDAFLDSEGDRVDLEHHQRVGHGVELTSGPETVHVAVVVLSLQVAKRLEEGALGAGRVGLVEEDTMRNLILLHRRVVEARPQHAVRGAHLVALQVETVHFAEGVKHALEVLPLVLELPGAADDEAPRGVRRKVGR